MLRTFKPKRFIFHVSAEYQGQYANWIPRLPLHPMAGEDTIFPRICFSYSISGALGASSTSGWSGQLLWVYIPDQHVEIVPNRVVRHFVPDARISGEVWVIKPIRVRAIGAIRVQGLRYQQRYRPYKGSNHWEYFRWWDWQVVSIYHPDAGKVLIQAYEKEYNKSSRLVLM